MDVKGRSAKSSDAAGEMDKVPGLLPPAMLPQRQVLQPIHHGQHTGQHKLHDRHAPTTSRPPQLHGAGLHPDFRARSRAGFGLDASPGMASRTRPSSSPEQGNIGVGRDLRYHHQPGTGTSPACCLATPSPHHQPAVSSVPAGNAWSSPRSSSPANLPHAHQQQQRQQVRNRPISRLGQNPPDLQGNRQAVVLPFPGLRSWYQPSSHQHRLPLQTPSHLASMGQGPLLPSSSGISNPAAAAGCIPDNRQSQQQGAIMTSQYGPVPCSHRMQQENSRSELTSGCSHISRPCVQATASPSMMQTRIFGPPRPCEHLTSPSLPQVKPGLALHAKAEQRFRPCSSWNESTWQD